MFARYINIWISWKSLDMTILSADGYIPQVTTSEKSSLISYHLHHATHYSPADMCLISRHGSVLRRSLASILRYRSDRKSTLPGLVRLALLREPIIHLLPLSNHNLEPPLLIWFHWVLEYPLSFKHVYAPSTTLKSEYRYTDITKSLHLNSGASDSYHSHPVISVMVQILSWP